MANSPTIQIVVPPELKAVLEADAAKEMLSVSALARRTLMRVHMADALTIERARLVDPGVEYETTPQEGSDVPGS